MSDNSESDNSESDNDFLSDTSSHLENDTFYREEFNQMYEFDDIIEELEKLAKMTGGFDPRFKRVLLHKEFIEEQKVIEFIEEQLHQERQQQNQPGSSAQHAQMGQAGSSAQHALQNQPGSSARSSEYSSSEDTRSSEYSSSVDTRSSEFIDIEEIEEMISQLPFTQAVERTNQR